MDAKTISRFKKLMVLAVALLCLPVVIKWDARADSADSHRATVAQNEARTTTSEKNTSSTEGEESEPGSEEKKESASTTQKPLKDFQPSEKIEAEQAVDFPYDI